MRTFCQWFEVSGTEFSPSELFDRFWNGGKKNETGLSEDDVDPDQLRMGIEVEYEHTPDREVSKRIALDHLAEFPDYYTALAEMEQKLAEKHGKTED